MGVLVLDDWDFMFEIVQALTRHASTYREGIERTIEFARAFPEEYERTEFWDRAEARIEEFPYEVVAEWAVEALSALKFTDDWDYRVLDLGDSPDIFRLYQLNGFEWMVEEKVRDRILTKCLMSIQELEECLKPEVGDPERALYSKGAPFFEFDHNVYELGDGLLSWNTPRTGFDNNGSDGSLLWLSFGAIGLMEPLRDREYCRAILKGCKRLYLIVGFEEIFFYLGTVTPEGLLFEEKDRIDLELLKARWRQRIDKERGQLDLLDLIGQAEGGPPDSAENHDHYLYGKESGDS